MVLAAAGLNGQELHFKLLLGIPVLSEVLGPLNPVVGCAGLKCLTGNGGPGHTGPVPNSDTAPRVSPFLPSRLHRVRATSLLCGLRQGEPAAVFWVGWGEVLERELTGSQKTCHRDASVPSVKLSGSQFPICM